MRNRYLLFMMFILCFVSLAVSQNLMDYVDEVRGDTLVINDFWDMGQEPNSLYYALILDTVDVPDGRVYMLKTAGYYPLVNSPTTIQKTVIVGDDNTILVNNDDANAIPPLICGSPTEGDPNTGGINPSHDLTVKNCSIQPATINADLGWNFFWGNVDSLNVILQNCLFEHTRWVFCATGAKGINWTLKDSYFVNMNGQPCRRNGGVIDVFNRQDTLLVENNTHIMAQGLVYKLRANEFGRVIMNHNTFINMGNLVLLDLGSQSNMSVTNNMFINCNVQPYVGGTHTIDDGEEDLEHMPVGIVNVIADTAVHNERRYVVDKNLIYWDSRLDDIDETAIANQVDGSVDWVPQMITMNSRSQAMFDDDATYPYLVEGSWIEAVPTFTDSKDLLTDQVDALKTYCSTAIDTFSSVVMPDWRLNSSDYVFNDWPIEIDLSYNDANLVSAGYGGFPLGDLNWFPAEKSSWLAQRDAEYAKIHTSLQTGVITGLKSANKGPSGFELRQNYPNPFNPTTNINFTLNKPGKVSLKVFNVLGQEVATLVNGFRTAKSYNIVFDASNLASGIYIYTLKFDNKTFTKKMVLAK